MSPNEIKEYNKFVKNHERCHFLQTLEWAKVKSNWKNEIIIVRDDNGKIEGTMSILIRKTPIFGRTILYCPRGPICDIENKEVFSKLITEVRKLAKKYKSFIFRMDPDIPNDNEKFKKIAIEAGLKLKKNINNNINKVIQPKYVMRLNLKDKTKDEVFASFSQKTRYNARLATKKGVIIEKGTRENIKDFHNILKETSSRDEFTIRELSYYEKVYDSFASENVTLLLAKYNDEIIASTFNIVYGNKAWYVYGGSLNKYRNYMPNHLIQWTMIQESMDRGCSVYDFRGVSGYVNENAHGYGVYRFKKGFNPDFIEFIDELNIIFNPFVNIIFNICEWLHKHIIRNIIKLIKGAK